MALKRQQIIDAIETRMALINGSGGYYLNVSNNVYVQRDSPFSTGKDNTEVPGINIVDGKEEPTTNVLKGSTNQWYLTMDVSIHLITEGSLDAAEVRKGIIDIKKACGVDLTWGGKAIDTIYTGTPEFAKDTETKKIIAATVNIQIKYSTDQWAEE